MCLCIIQKSKKIVSDDSDTEIGKKVENKSSSAAFASVFAIQKMNDTILVGINRVDGTKTYASYTGMLPFNCI